MLETAQRSSIFSGLKLSQTGKRETLADISGRHIRLKTKRGCGQECWIAVQIEILVAIRNDENNLTHLLVI